MEAKELKEKVKQVLQKYQHDKSVLVDILHDIQAESGYLPREVLEETSLSLIHISEPTRQATSRMPSSA